MGSAIRLLANLFLNPAVNGYLFRIREGLYMEEEGCAPPFMCAVPQLQWTSYTHCPSATWLWKVITFIFLFLFFFLSFFYFIFSYFFNFVFGICIITNVDFFLFGIFPIKLPELVSHLNIDNRPFSHCAHAYIGHVARYFSIIGETLQRMGKRILSH